MTRNKTTAQTTVDTPVAEPATQAEISVYQQLRQHLAILKLHAAAEALPGMLERAQGEGWSMTGMLEQLLAVEVEETKPDDWPAGSDSQACRPRPPSIASTTTPHPGWTAH